MKKKRGINKGIAIFIVVAIMTSLLSMTAMAAPVTGTVTVPAGVTTFSIDLVVSEATQYAGIMFELMISDESAADFVSFTPSYTGSSAAPFGERDGWHFFGFYTGSNAFYGGKVGTINFTGYTGNQELVITVRMIVIRIVDGKTVEYPTDPSHIFTVERGEADPEPPVYHTVTFNPAGGTRTSGGALVQVVLHGGAAIAPIVVREGYTFAGWQGSFTNVTADVTVTAQWTPVSGGGPGPGEPGEPPSPPPPPASGVITVPAGVTTFSIDLWVEVDEAYAGIEFGITIGNPNVKFESFSPSYSGASAMSPSIGNGAYYSGFYAGTNAFQGTSAPANVGRMNFSGYSGDQPFIIQIVELSVYWVNQDNQVLEIITQPLTNYSIQRAGVTPVYHTVTFDPAGGTRTGGGALSQQVLHGSAAVEPILAPRDGFTLSWDEPFTNVTSNLTVKAVWTPVGDGPVYTVTFDPAGGTRTGGGALSQQVPQGGSAIAPTVTRGGYTFNGWQGSYTEVISDVTVTAQWTLVNTGGGTPGPGPGTTTLGDDPGTEIVDDPPILGDFPDLPFIDVNRDHWFYSDVEFMYLQGLMNGTAANLFSPNGAVTRGMVVTVLYRMEGEPDVSELENPFKDVADGMFYTDAVIWAAANEIVLGFTSERYGPTENVTREQLAAILHRYQEFKEDELPDVNPPRVFADNDKIRDYAKIPVDTLVRQGIINGKNNNMFDPRGNATRAEFAAMLHRYLLAAGVFAPEPPEIPEEPPEEPPVEAPEES